MQKVSLSAGGIWVLVATIVGSSLVWIESSALNVALDAIQQALQASGSQLIWIVNIYLLFLAAFILISGSLGDRFGRKKVFAIGVGVFTLASVACGVAPSIELLIVARAVQGFGGALMVPGSLAIITASIADEDRGRAIGIWSASSAVTTLIGPVLGGFLASAGWWRAIFFISIPLALVIFLVLPKVPESRNRNASEQLDYLGAIVLAAGIGLLTFGALQLGEVTTFSFKTYLAIGSLVLGMITLVGFIWLERHSSHPMLDLDLFRSRTFSGANAMTACLYAGLGGALLFVPLNLIQVQGYTPTMAGLATLTTTLSLAVLSPFAGSWVQRIGPRILLTVGPAIAGIGFALLGWPSVTAGPSAYWTSFFPGLLVLGLGMGITVAPLTTTVMSAAPDEKSGVASGINNAVTRTAQALATGLLGALMLFIFSTTLTPRLEQVDLPADTRSELQAAAPQLGNITIPEQLQADTQTAVDTAIKRSFVQGFRWVVGAAAVLAWLSALLSWLMIDPEVVETEQPEQQPDHKRQNATT